MLGVSSRVLIDACHLVMKRSIRKSGSLASQLLQQSLNLVLISFFTPPSLPAGRCPPAVRVGWKCRRGGDDGRAGWSDQAAVAGCWGAGLLQQIQGVPAERLRLIVRDPLGGCKRPFGWWQWGGQAGTALCPGCQQAQLGCERCDNQWEEGSCSS